MSKKLIVFSGAGLSADSGVATFRDSDGLWANYDPMEVCNFQNWEENYELVHRFYNLRRAELRSVSPNAMHEFLASLPKILAQNLASEALTSENLASEALANENLTSEALRQKSSTQNIEVVYLTQNVDDLLERAGAKNVIHLHGELTKIICPKCGYIIEIGYDEFDISSACPKCASKKLKPKIVFFYENAPLYEKMYAEFGSLGRGDMVLVVGTSGNVVPISYILRSNANIGYKILNNLAPSPHIDEGLFDTVIYQKAVEAFPQIKQEISAFFAKN